LGVASQAMKDSGFYFVHMSDAHVLGEPSQEIHGVRPAYNLRAAVQYINSLNPRPDFCIHTGDSVSEESEKAYLLFKEELASLKIPTYFAIGNHDDRASFRKLVLTALPDDAPYYYDFELQGWHFVVLDSSDRGQVSGRIDNAQLLWLEQALQQHPRQPTFVFLHHHPLPLGIPWLDELMLQDSARLIEVLRRAPWVRRVFFGHVHHECHLSLDNLHFAAVPALSFQFSEIAETEKFSSLPPGFRLVHVQGEMIRTLVYRLA
jgi:3',5'-cyclic-AMP phosphodiesterase